MTRLEKIKSYTIGAIGRLESSGLHNMSEEGPLKDTLWLIDRVERLELALRQVRDLIETEYLTDKKTTMVLNNDLRCSDHYHIKYQDKRYCICGKMII